MLRRTRYSLSLSSPLSEPRPEPVKPVKPVKKGGRYQWSPIPEKLSTEPVEDIDEYVQEWNFPYPGQK